MTKKTKPTKAEVEAMANWKKLNDKWDKLKFSTKPVSEGIKGAGAGKVPRNTASIQENNESSELAIPLLGVFFNKGSERYEFHYWNKEYSYATTRNEKGGTECQLKCSREFLQRFATSVGACNSIDLPHLLILEREDSNWHVTSLYSTQVVVRFLHRLNGWALRNNPEFKPDTVQANKRQYEVSADTVMASSHHTRVRFD